jgi:hypothetical protein
MFFFLILPTYALLLLMLGGAAALTWCIPRLRPASGYLVGGALGSLAGFVVVNAFILAMGVAPAWLAHEYSLSEWVRSASKVYAVATLMLGPIIGSFAGILLGFAGGWWCVRRRRLNLNRATSPLAPPSPL